MKRRSLPWIGVTGDTSAPPADESTRKSEPTLLLPRRYTRAVEAAGGVAVILPPSASPTKLRELVNRLDGILISGGDFDIHPSFYGEKPIGELGKLKPERTEFELELTVIALKRDLPVLGICGGAQAINVALGGSLYQDIATQCAHHRDHQQEAQKESGGHRVQIEPDTRLRHVIRRQNLEVNTTHHQAVKRLGKGLVVNATAEDGLIEGIESSNHSFLLGVQWHPEVLAPRHLPHRRIFSFFVSICGCPRATSKPSPI
jgi:putative glutamine amidotransferase